MADDYLYVVAAGIALGRSQNDMENLIAENRKRINQVSNAVNDGWVRMIRVYLIEKKTASHEDSATNFYNDFLRTVKYADYGIEEFPKSASALSRKLGDMEEMLLKNGIVFKRHDGKLYNSISITDMKFNPNVISGKSNISPKHKSLLDSDDD